MLANLSDRPSLRRFTVTLDRDPAVYTVGEMVTGTVTVMVKEPFVCRELRVVCGVVPVGRGYSSRTKEDRVSLPLFAGDWAADQPYTYPFAFPAPDGPISYDGHLFVVEWSVRAEIDVPGVDNRVSVPMTLLPDPDAETYHFGQLFLNADGQRANERARGAAGCLLLGIFVPFLLFPACVIGGVVWGVSGNGQVGVGVAVALFVAFMIVAALVTGVVREWLNRWALRSIGEIAVDVDRLTRRGDLLTCRLNWTPRATVTAQQVAIEVIAEERLRVSSGASTVRTHRIHTQQATFYPQTLAAGVPTTVWKQMPIPRDAVPTLETGWCDVRWTVTVTVRTPGAPPWKRDMIVAVRP